MTRLRFWWLLPCLLFLSTVAVGASGVLLAQYGPPDFDSWLLLWFRTTDQGLLRHDPAGGAPIWLAITSLGNTAPRLVLASAVLFYLLLAHRKQSALFVAVVLVSGFALSTTVKVLVGRARPQLVSHLDQVSLGSFPSGHALNGILFYGLMALMLAPCFRYRIARMTVYTTAAVLSLAVGLSRVALGVHYPSDVFAGWFIGAAWLALWVILAENLWPEVFQQPPYALGDG